MDNTCWPYVIHMVIRVGCTVVRTDHEQQYIRQLTLYQELYQVFLCYSIQELFYYPILRILDHNIRTQFLVLDCLTLALKSSTLYLFLTEGQHRPLVKKSTAGPQAQEVHQLDKGSLTVYLYQSPLVHGRYITFCGRAIYNSSFISLILQFHL